MQGNTLDINDLTSQAPVVLTSLTPQTSPDLADELTAMPTLLSLFQRREQREWAALTCVVCSHRCPRKERRATTFLRLCGEPPASTARASNNSSVRVPRMTAPGCSHQTVEQTRPSG